MIEYLMSILKRLNLTVLLTAIVIVDILGTASMFLTIPSYLLGLLSKWLMDIYDNTPNNK